ncbi:zinc-binding alcohol dehydrogenase family protein [Streptomyces sp. ACA25]|uniref:zinc-binding alcohol dehydrogenase family protein n=1 Tax=Streptomyces sp. ACA25 TaxID=3022596 RepID=UPI0023073DD1|nr:zinc-binding alcohol dehydrogenase family protein [Streptomyces sp. ACA25]MDB1088552.1 zinc-binding alcohol dehydrogenase family protein [Streptomyces sp. ACA25]
MRAWVVRAPGQLDAVELPVPRPAPDELLVRVRACGVCRTDLHVRDGDLAPHRSPVVPGHEAVGVVVAAGSQAGIHPVGTRVGVPWLRRTCGTCRYCLRGDENLCPASEYTGWDADGGYAEYLTVPASYAYPLPAALSDVHAAPLLCAGIIGHRALRRAELPPGGRLGIYGFGGSAHLTAQTALGGGAVVHVLTRSAAARALALRLGAASAGDAYGTPPEPLDAAILFAPVGDLVPVALEALDAGGTLSVAGIHLSTVPALDYHRHLFRERTLRSVTANTRDDGRRFLALAADLRVTATVTLYPFDRAADALDDLAADRVNGAAVLRFPA